MLDKIVDRKIGDLCVFHEAILRFEFLKRFLRINTTVCVEKIILKERMNVYRICMEK